MIYYRCMCAIQRRNQLLKTGVRKWSRFVQGWYGSYHMENKTHRKRIIRCCLTVFFMSGINATQHWKKNLSHSCDIRDANRLVTDDARHVTWSLGYYCHEILDVIYVLQKFRKNIKSHGNIGISDCLFIRDCCGLRRTIACFSQFGEICLLPHTMENVSFLLIYDMSLFYITTRPTIPDG